MPDPLASPAPPAPAPDDPWRRALAAGAVMALAVFAASLVGTWTRPLGHLAALWPANAVLLGLMVRYPQLAVWTGWVGAVLGFLAAGVTAGDPWRENLLLTLGNLVGVVTGYLVYHRYRLVDRRLESPASVLRMMVVIAAAAAAAAVVGAFIDPLLFGGRPMGGGLRWFLTEAVNYIAILPTLLTLPAWGRTRAPRRWRRQPLSAWALVAPLGLLLVSLAVGVLVDGPGALAFPVLPLMWCALVYGLFATSLLTLLFSVWTLIAIANGWLMVAMDADPTQLLTSIRLGVTMIAVCPIVVASVTAAREAVLQQVRYLAEHDSMTGAKNRRMFHDQSAAGLISARAAREPVALLILDIDHFKSINDSFGHVVGDRVIVRTARCIADALAANAPDNTVFGRLGGEEFGVFVHGIGRDALLALAEGIRQACEQAAVELDGARRVTVTASVGCAWDEGAAASLEALMQAADAALYRAKHAGRNRVAG